MSLSTWTPQLAISGLQQEHAKIAGENSRDSKYLTLARGLIEKVHDVRGRSRLSRATDENPLGGGLRIGNVDECGPDGDGQYHHCSP